jgi:hypothetical protein
VRGESRWERGVQRGEGELERGVARNERGEGSLSGENGDRLTER